MEVNVETEAAAKYKFMGLQALSRKHRNGGGTGAEHYTDLYTRQLYSKILSKEYIHSTRDRRTAEFLESMGYRAIVTGCPTIWRCTSEFCSAIPKDKSAKVVFTVTSGDQDRKNDQKLINIAKNNYDEVYFWIQGLGDFEYFRSFDNIDNIHIVENNLESYITVLSMPDVEYIGTRLHAGLFALQYQKRAIILAIDNRARDMSLSYNLPVIERQDIDNLPAIINSTFSTDVKLNQKNIDIWLNQFRVKDADKA